MDHPERNGEKGGSSKLSKSIIIGVIMQMDTDVYMSQNGNSMYNVRSYTEDNITPTINRKLRFFTIDPMYLEYLRCGPNCFRDSRKNRPVR